MEDLTHELNALLEEMGFPPERELIGKLFSVSFVYKNENRRISGTILGTDLIGFNSVPQKLLTLITTDLGDLFEPGITIKYKLHSEDHCLIYFIPKNKRDGVIIGKLTLF